MANPNYRIVIPTAAKPLLDLAKEVFKKHQELSDQSPLRTLQSHTWEANGTKVATALDYHNEAEEHKRKAEELFKKRDLLITEIDHSVKASRDILTGVYRENLKQLGEWGFEVNSSVRKTKGDEKTV